jgi:sec-independent protein translocase protein TatB
VEFLGIGYQEILVIMAILLVVVGPERMPGMAYQIGRAVRTLQQYARAVRDEFRDEFDYLDEQMKTLKGGVDDLNKTMREGERELRRDLDGVAPAKLLEDEHPSNVVPFGQLPPPVNGNGASGSGSSPATPPGETAESPSTEPASEPEPAPESPKEPLVF